MMTSCAVSPLKKSEELEYWKKRSREMQQRNELLEQELQEFHENSVILEKELETSYDQANKQNRELRSENLKLMASNQILKIRLNEHADSCAIIQTKLQNQQTYNDELFTSVRNLEQKNEKLERYNRELELSVKVKESQLDELLEKLAITETELADKMEGYKILVQRLKDENTELKQQIAVDVAQQNKRSSIIKGIELATTFKLLTTKKTSADDSHISIDDLECLSKDDMLKYVQRLAQKLEALEIAERRSQASEQHMSTMYDDALEKIAFLETELEDKENIKKPANEVADDSILNEPEVQLRSHHKRSKSTDKARSKSATIKVKPEKPVRSSVPGRLSRHVEHRVKKVKEEEKRQQNLTGFLKRLRHGHTGWLRKKD